MESIAEKKVQDIMIPIYDYPVVSSQATIKDTVRVLMNCYHQQQNKPRTGRKRVFVVEQNDLVGIFGIAELFAAIEPHYLSRTLKGSLTAYATWHYPVFWEGMFTEMCQEIATRPVKEFMSPVELYVNVNDTLLKASYQMTKHKADAVAVKRNGRLVGMIRSADILHEISRLFTHPEQLDYSGWPQHSESYAAAP